ncbi:MAG: threonine-phosphate decarboxylase CobD [Thermodesulfovibrionales bacterium]|nr:threonine-phosphate decarboxylase CobD [Thermodesulfovibrionales bacterium]
MRGFFHKSDSRCNYEFLHGGDIYSLLMEGFRYEDIIDFSASVNPLGPPDSVMNALRDNPVILRHYPDPCSWELRRAIADEHNIEPDRVITGNGSTELIYLLVRSLRPKRALIPAPTFSEYERACRIYGSEVEIYHLYEEDKFDIDPDKFISSLITSYSSRSFNMVFLCNPNNPTGRLMKREDVIKIAEAVRDLKCYLVVDEAFMDFVPEESIINMVKENPYLIVLRSMTKFYGLAGLRLGYGVFDKDLAEELLYYKEPWTVNGPAQIAGITSLNDKAFRLLTLQVTEEWKKDMESLFEERGIYYIPSAANFYIFKAPERTAEILRKKGILIRDCSNFRGLKKINGYAWFRVSVRNPEENRRLMEALKYAL